jgi:hypothetical protein
MSLAVGVMMKEMIMTIKELIWQLKEALKFHDQDELICIYNQETGELIDIETVDDTINNEVHLIIKGITNE